MKTKIVRPVDSSPLLTEALAYFDQHCEQHSDGRIYTLVGPLRHGKTVWLKSDKNTKFRFGLREHFDICMRFITAIQEEFGYDGIGRAYIHRLKPGEHIDRHADVAEEYFFKVDRFQVYLNFPEGMVVQHDGEQGPNSLIYFNKHVAHEYRNNSQENWYLLVFDLEKK